MPGHEGIPDNEKVDKAAKQASHRSTILKSPLPLRFTSSCHISKSMRQQWLASWKDQCSKANELALFEETPLLGI